VIAQKGPVLRGPVRGRKAITAIVEKGCGSRMIRVVCLPGSKHHTGANREPSCKVARVYADDHGESHFGEVELPMSSVTPAPDMQPVLAGPLIAAKNVQFLFRISVRRYRRVAYRAQALARHVSEGRPRRESERWRSKAFRTNRPSLFRGSLRQRPFKHSTE
jgi:hypothetical protein